MYSTATNVLHQRHRTSVNLERGLPKTPTISATRCNGSSFCSSRLSLLAKVCLGIPGTHGDTHLAAWARGVRYPSRGGHARDIKSFCAYFETAECHIVYGEPSPSARAWLSRDTQVSRAKRVLINISQAPLVWVIPLPCYDQTIRSDERPLL